MKSLTLAALLVVVLGCAGPAATPRPGGGPLMVVTTTTVFGDLVKQVGGDRVEVHSLVPRGGEVHTFDPAPSDAVALNRARLLILNGLGLDDWLLSFAQQAGADGIPLLALGENLEGVQYLEGAQAFNPHLWMSPAYARLYVDRIRLKLGEIDPAGQAAYDVNADAYDQRLAELDAWVAQQLGAVPAERRKVVSFHDAFPYFARAYGIEIVGVVVEAPGQDPSAAEVVRLVQAIRAAGVSAILTETQFNPDVAQTIAAETGAAVVGGLYTDTLGDSPIDTYEAAIRFDVEQIRAALE